jgi:LytR cell envelope-related transcriptional attenuator
MATPPRSQQRDSGSRSMSSRTVAVTVAVLALGGYVVYKGLNKPNTLSTDGSSVTTSKPGKPGATTVATTVAGGATTAPPLVATTASTPVNAKIDVVVANGAEIQGIAAEISTVLQKKGYQLGKATNATPVEASAVYFTAGNDKLGALVAKDLNIPTVGALTTTPPGVANLGSAGVLVVLGKTFKKADVPKESALQPGAPAAPGITAATAAAAVTTVKPAAAVTTPATTAKKP